MIVKSTKPSCKDCYFRQSGLCAIPGEIVCPTFRAASTKGLVPPRQPQLLLQPVPALGARVA